MNPLNSMMVYEVAELKHQRDAFSRLLQESLPTQPAESSDARQAISRTVAEIFAVSFGNDATRDYAIELLNPDPTDAAVFLHEATEFLAALNSKTKVSFVVQTRQKEKEFGPL